MSDFKVWTVVDSDQLYKEVPSWVFILPISVNRDSVFFFHTESYHVDHWINTEQELWYLLSS